LTGCRTRWMPISQDAGPTVVPPTALSRDFLELALNSQQEALLKIDLALDRLE